MYEEVEKAGVPTFRRKESDSHGTDNDRSFNTDVDMSRFHVNMERDFHTLSILVGFMTDIGDRWNIEEVYPDWVYRVFCASPSPSLAAPESPRYAPEVELSVYEPLNYHHRAMMNLMRGIMRMVMR
ncbi:hypothetical protein Trydic_g3764 [Trypoxylus dichotomus]